MRKGVLRPENNETWVKLGGATQARGRVCWIHFLGDSEGVEFADQQSQVEMLHDADEGKTFVRWRRLGRKGVEETRDISPDLLGPANGPRW